MYHIVQISLDAFWCVYSQNTPTSFRDLITGEFDRVDLYITYHTTMIGIDKFVEVCGVTFRAMWLDTLTYFTLLYFTLRFIIFSSLRVCAYTAS